MTREVENGKVAFKGGQCGRMDHHVWQVVPGRLLITRLENKKLSYRRGTARCVVSIEILPIATQQCRNYLYDKS